MTPDLEQCQEQKMNDPKGREEKQNKKRKHTHTQKKKKKKKKHKKKARKKILPGRKKRTSPLAACNPTSFK